MVSIVGGSELGLNANSGKVLGGQGETGTAGQGRAGEGVTINAVTGNLVLQRQDEFVAGQGLDLNVLRTYNSQGQLDADNNDQWEMSYSRRVTALNGNLFVDGDWITRTNEEGANEKYIYESALDTYVYRKGDGSYDTMTFDIGEEAYYFVWTDGATQNREIYNSDGLLTRVVDTHGNEVTLVRDANSRLLSVTNEKGEQTEFVYGTGAAANNVLEVRTRSTTGALLQTRVRYGYDGSQRLTSITVDLSPTDNSVADGKIYVTTYTYDGTSKRIASIGQTDGSWLEFTYVEVGSDYRVRSVMDKRIGDDGLYTYSTTSFNYDIANNRTLVIDGSGRQTFWTYDAINNQVQSIRQLAVDGGLNSDTLFTYDTLGNVSTVTDPLGRTTTYGYDTHGNRTLERDTLGNTLTRTFNDRNQLTSETTYTGVDPDGSGVNPATGGRTKYFVYDANLNLAFTVSPEGRVTRYTYDAQLRPISEAVYVETFNPQVSAPALAMLNTWANGQKAKAQRTDMAYDTARGVLASTTRFTSVDANGNGVDGATTHYIYNQAGQLLQSIDANGGATNYTYDGLGRIQTVVDPSSKTTLTTYDDANRRTTINVDVYQNLGGGSITTLSFDEAGLLLAMEKGDSTTPALSTTSYVYDKRGNLIREIGPSGASTYHIYDAANRRIADIDPAGALVEYVYGDVRIATTGLTTTETLTYTSPTNVKLNLGLTAPQPNGAPLYAIVKTYANGVLLNTANVMSFTGVNPTTASLNNIDIATADLLTVEIYQGDVLLGETAHSDIKARRDAAALLYQTNGNTQVIQSPVTIAERALFKQSDQILRTIRYAMAVKVGLIYIDVDGLARQSSGVADASTLKLDGVYDGINGLRPTTSAWTTFDRVDYQFFDAAGRLVKTVDTTGGMVEHFYDGAGQRIVTQQSATRLTWAQLTALRAMVGAIAVNDPNAILPGGLTDYRTVQYSYGADGQLTGTFDADNYWTVNRYDAAGQLIETIQRALSGFDKFGVSNAADLHTYYLHDGKGQLTGVIDPAGYLTEYRYDAVGNKTSETRYANAVTVFDPLKPVGDVRPTTFSTEDRTTAYAYDGFNQLMFTFEYQGAFRLDYSESTDGLSTYYLYYDANGKPSYILRGQGSPYVMYWAAANADASTLEQRITNRIYDSFGRVVKEMSPTGYKTMLTPLEPLPGETPAQLLSRTQARDEGLWTLYTYDASGRMTSKTDPVDSEGRANVTLYFYDSNGRLVDIVDSSGTVQEMTYTVFGEIDDKRTYETTLPSIELGLDRSQLTPANAALVRRDRFAYDQLGQLIAKTYGEDSVNIDSSSNRGFESFAYNAFGEVFRHEVATAGTTRVSEQYDYNRRGLVTSTIRDSGTGNLNLTTITDYDAFGRATKVTDARGKEWSKSYDKLGRVITVTDPGTPQRSIAYDAFGRVIKQTDVFGKETTFVYNAASRTLTTTTPELIVTTVTTDMFGQVISLQDGRGNITSYTYDLEGRLLDVAAPIGSGSQVAHKASVYNGAGHLIEVVENGIKTVYTYDAAGRVLTRTVDAGDGPDHLNITTRTLYNLSGENIWAAGADGIWTQDASGVWTQTRYDLKGEVTSVIVDPLQIPDDMGGLQSNPDGLNIRTEYAYDRRGNKVKVIEGAGSANPKVTMYEYDKTGRRIAERVDPTGTLNITTSYTYDANDNVVTRKDPNGNVTRYVYDAKNQLTYSIDPTGAVVKTDYDAAGRVIQVTAYADRISLSGFAAPSTAVTGELTLLDVQNKLTTAILNNVDNQVRYTVYDNDGRARFEIDAKKAVTERQYDKNGNIIRTARYAVAITVPLDRTIANLQAAINAVNIDSIKNQIEYTAYDRANRATYFVDADGYGTQSVYDNNGRVIRQIQAFYWPTVVFNGTDTLTVTPGAAHASDRKTRMFYDAVGRLRFAVDGEGFVTEHRFDARGLETMRIRYATKQSITDSDTFATMLARFDDGLVAGDVQESNVFDAAGRLDTTTVGNASDLATVQHVYDAAGREIDTISNVDLATQSTVHRVYDAAGRLTNEYSAFGTDYVSRIQYVLDKAGNRVQVIDPNGNSGYFYFDGANRAVAQVDPERYLTQTTYTAFGTVQKIIHYANKVQGTLSTTAVPVAVTTNPGAGPYLIIDNTRDQTTSIVHDQRNRQTSITDAEGYAESMAYDALGNKVSYTNKLQGTYTYTYNRRGLVILETAPVLLAGTSVYQAKSYVYDTRGNLTVMTENSSATAADQKRVTNFAYDLENRQIKKSNLPFTGGINASGGTAVLAPTEVRTFDARGNLIEVAVYRDATAASRVNDQRTLYYYDALDRKIAQIDPTGALTVWRYEGAGKPSSELRYNVRVTLPATGGALPQIPADPDVRQTDFVYDGSGRLLTSTLRNVTLGEQLDPVAGYATREQGVTTTNVYDGNGNVVKMIDGHGNAALGTSGYATYHYYNKLNQLIMTVDALHYVTTWTRDANGNILTETRYATALASQPSSTTTPPAPPAVHPDDRITSFVYDRMGNVRTKSVANVRYGSSTASQLFVESRSNPTGIWPQFYGNTTYTSTTGTTFTTTVTMGENSTGRRLVVGLNNGATGNAHQRVTAYFRDDELVAQYYDLNGSYNEYVLAGSGSIKPNTAYAIKIEMTDAGPRLTVTSQNGQQASWTKLFSPTTKWNNVRLFGATYMAPGWGTPATRDGLGPLKIVNGAGEQLVYEDFNKPMSANYTGLDAGAVASQLMFYDNNLGAMTTGRAELVGSAVTEYEYNGLGQIKKTTQRADAGSGTPVTEVTDIAYDAIGRQTSVENPGFVDYTNNYVRPKTQYTYNGLDQVTSETDVHAATDTTATDRVSTYTYDKGRLVSQKDAAGNETKYYHDAAGNIMKKVLVGRITADWPTVAGQDDVTLYQYDGAGREVMHQDVGTGEVRGTRYNAFGEITGKRLGGLYTLAAGVGTWSNSNWQEVADYNVQGKAWRTNSGDGAYKVYLFDGNGNATLTIESAGSDLATQTLNQILGIDPGPNAVAPVAEDSNLTISVYDARNQLIDTYQPTMVADGRLNWSVQQVLTQPPGAPYAGGAASAQNQQGTMPVMDQAASMSSFYASQVSISLAGHDLDIRGGEHWRLFTAQERTVTFWGIPDYRGAGFGKIEIDFTLDRWIQPGFPLVNPNKNTYSGYTTKIYADSGSPTAQVSVYETGYDDDRKTGERDAPSRTGSFIMWAVNSATGVKVLIGGGAINFTVQKYFNNEGRNWERYYHMESGLRTVGANQLQFNVPSARSLDAPLTDQLTLWVRPQGGNGLWIPYNVPRGTNYAGQPVIGYYVLQPDQPGQILPHGNYEFFYSVQDVNGKVLTAQTGNMTIGGASSIVSSSQAIGLPGYSVIGGYAALLILHQGSGVSGVNITYREVGTLTWSAQQAATYLAPFGWLLNPSPTNLIAGRQYEFLVETKDAANKVINKARGVFTGAGGALAGTIAGDTIKPLKDQIIKFTNEPLSAVGDNVTTMELEYSTTGGAPWTTAERITQGVNRTTFTWDPTEMLVNKLSSATFSYRYKIKDSKGKILTQAQGVVNLSNPLAAPTITHANYGKVPTTMTFSPAQPEAQYMKLYVRTHSTNPAATYTEVGISRGATGFVWDATQWAPAILGTTALLDYKYDLYASASSTTVLKGLDDQPLHVVGTITLGGTQPKFSSSFLLTGANDTSITIHRSQDYNAFGEIAEQIDGRVNAGTTPGDFMDGLPNTTHLYYNTLGKLVQKKDPYTENLAVVQVNGVVTMPAPTQPRTFYTYDLLGRLVGTQDANGNRNTQTVLAGFGGDGLEPALTTAEYHADTRGVAAKTMAYDSFGNARRVVEQLNNVDQRIALQEFDKNDRLIKVTQAQRASGSASYVPGKIDEYAYDQAGQRIVHKVITTINNVSNTVGGVITRTGATSATYYEKTYYDSLGRVIKTTDMQGLSTTYVYTPDANIRGADGAVVGGYRKETILPLEANWTGYTYTGPTTNAYDDLDYFGRIAKHGDFGGNTFTYEYNKAGWLIHQWSTGSGSQGSGAQDIEFEYYANGYQQRIYDKKTGAISYYEYDNEGNRIREEYRKEPPGGGAPQSYQSSLVVYDQLNRVVKISSPVYTITYQYDANGNRIHMLATYQDPVYGTPKEQNYWYQYDQMNRFTVTMGRMTIFGIVDAAADQGVQIKYDWAGQRIQAVYRDTTTYPAHKETYTYTADGYLEDTWINDNPDGAGNGVLRARRTSDGLGRVTAYEEWNASGTKTLTRRSSYNINSQLLQQQEWNGNLSGGAVRTTTYQYANSGAMVQAQYVDTTPGTGITTTSDYSYVWWDEAKQKEVTIHNTSPNRSGHWAPGYAKFIYDMNGHIVQMNDPAYNTANPSVYIARTVKYTTDAQGLILLRDETGNGKPSDNGNGDVDTTVSGASNRRHTFYYLNGHAVGDVGNDGMRRMSYAESLAVAEQQQKKNNDKKYGTSWQPISSADFDANYEPVTASYPSVTPGSYTVRAGDTLQSIAAAMWGDSAMWYMIADANGLTGNEVLVADQTLTIPNKLTNIHNNSSTYRIFDAAETMGNTDPTLPAPPAPPPPKRSKKGCGGIGTILIAVVAIVASVFTVGAALAALGGAGFGAAMSAGAAAVMGGLGTAMGAVTFGVAFTAGAIGAAVGSILSQGLGMAMGMQDKFSWKQVGISAIGGGITAGLGSSTFNGVFSAGTAGTLQQAAVGNVMTQGISQAVGLQEKFSWTQVAASVVGAGVGEIVGDLTKGFSFGLNQFGTQVVRGTLRGLASGGVSQAVSGERPNWGAIAMESFGNSLGNALTTKQVDSDVQLADTESQSTGTRQDLESVVDIAKLEGQGAGYLAEMANSMPVPALNVAKEEAIRLNINFNIHEMMESAFPEYAAQRDYLARSSAEVQEMLSRSSPSPSAGDIPTWADVNGVAAPRAPKPAWQFPYQPEPYNGDLIHDTLSFVKSVAYDSPLNLAAGAAHLVEMGIDAIPVDVQDGINHIAQPLLTGPMGLPSVALGGLRLAGAKIGEGVPNSAVIGANISESQIARTSSNFGRYAEREALVQEVISANQSPWPLDYTPSSRSMSVGEQFNMVIDADQAAGLRGPGGFGTFVDIPDQTFARQTLAITEQFKADVSYMQRYEVVRPFNSLEGPIGPQIDQVTGGLLPGSKSIFQLDLQLPWNQRTQFLKPIGQPVPLKK